MNLALTNTQIDGYRDLGFLHVPGFLNSREVDELKSAVLESVSTMGSRKVAGQGAAIVEGESYYDRVFIQRINLWRISDTVKSYMLGPDLGQMVGELAGVEGMRVWHDQTLIKAPFANPTAFHLDNPYWSFHSRDSLSIWIALDDATLENGCMWFIPGTHRLARFENSNIGENIGELFKVYPEMAEIDPMAVPMKAGDCSFHNGLVAHGAGANMTRGSRVAMTCSYMPDGCTFNGNPNILPREYLETLNVGDVLNNDEQNPLVFSRS
jgi:phytanoyl-CoA hydroxylase